MTWRTCRKVSANTHFEEWWFKTFLYEYGKCGYIFVSQNQLPFGAGFLFALFSENPFNQ
jgi:hypothetical protein